MGRGAERAWSVPTDNASEDIILLNLKVMLSETDVAPKAISGSR